MKKILLTLAVLGTAISLHAQGRVAFANNPSTPITLQSSGANISGSGTYRFGLYVGPAGTPEALLELVGTGLNGIVAGQFSGGNPFTLPSSTTLSPGGYPAGTAIAFQIRAWTAAAGASYEVALGQSANLANVYGKSPVGSANPTASPAAAATLFGAAAGQVGGFALAPVPEPSTIALALLGGSLLLFRRRSVTK